MIRTFPEASLVIVTVDRTVFIDAPVPLAVLLVYEACLDIVPAAGSYVEILLRSEVLPQIYVTNYFLALLPLL